MAEKKKPRSLSKEVAAGKMGKRAKDWLAKTKTGGKKAKTKKK